MQVIGPQSTAGPHGTTDGDPREPRPLLSAATRVEQLPQRDIERVVTWIVSDGVHRSDEDLIREVMHELGFHKLGRRVHKSIVTAIARVRARRRA